MQYNVVTAPLPCRSSGERRRPELAEEELPEDEGAGGERAAQPRRHRGREIRSEKRWRAGSAATHAQLSTFGQAKKKKKKSQWTDEHVA